MSASTSSPSTSAARSVVQRGAPKSLASASARMGSTSNTAASAASAERAMVGACDRRMIAPAPTSPMRSGAAAAVIDPPPETSGKTLAGLQDQRLVALVDNEGIGALGRAGVVVEELSFIPVLPVLVRTGVRHDIRLLRRDVDRVGIRRGIHVDEARPLRAGPFADIVVNLRRAERWAVAGLGIGRRRRINGVEIGCVRGRR